MLYGSKGCLCRWISRCQNVFLTNIKLNSYNYIPWLFTWYTSIKMTPIKIQTFHTEYRISMGKSVYNPAHLVRFGVARGRAFDLKGKTRYFTFTWVRYTCSLGFIHHGCLFYVDATLKFYIKIPFCNDSLTWLT